MEPETSARETYGLAQEEIVLSEVTMVNYENPLDDPSAGDKADTMFCVIA